MRRPMQGSPSQLKWKVLCGFMHQAGGRRGIHGGCSGPAVAQSHRKKVGMSNPSDQVSFPGSGPRGDGGSWVWAAYGRWAGLSAGQLLWNNDSVHCRGDDHSSNVEHSALSGLATAVPQTGARQLDAEVISGRLQWLTF